MQYIILGIYKTTHYYAEKILLTAVYHGSIELPQNIRAVMSYTCMENKHKLTSSKVIVLKIRQYNRGKQIVYGSNWD